jgi:hypothetical protein
MYGKGFSSEFLYMQNRAKKGKNNPMYGLKKSALRRTLSLNYKS